MRSITATEIDGKVVAGLVESAEPRPAPGEVLVRVAGSGLNRADLLQIAGAYPPPAGESPILGMEVSGSREDTGDRVCALLAGGGHAELVAVPEGQLFRAPAALTAVAAAAIPEVFLTAYLNLDMEAKLQAGESLLVHAGASGVGLAAIQTGRRLGARVAATTRSRQKLAAMRDAGAELAIATADADFAAEIERAWGPASIDVILDPVGAKTLEGNFRVLAKGGRVVYLAGMSGSRLAVDLGALLGKRARLIGSTLRSRSRTEKAVLVARFAAEMLPAFDRGEMHVTVDSTFPPAKASEAFERMRDNLNVGKILLDWTHALDES